MTNRSAAELRGLTCRGAICAASCYPALRGCSAEPLPATAALIDWVPKTGASPGTRPTREGGGGNIAQPASSRHFCAALARGPTGPVPIPTWWVGSAGRQKRRNRHQQRQPVRAAAGPQPWASSPRHRPRGVLTGRQSSADLRGFG